MSNMKCPICGSEMSISYGTGEELFSCSNVACKASYFFATDDMWQELIKVMEENKCTRKMLKIAIGAIETIKYSKKSDAINLRHKANKALIEIWKIKDQTTLEQKETK